jgi:hypothetical protein
VNAGEKNGNGDGNGNGNGDGNGDGNEGTNMSAKRSLGVLALAAAITACVVGMRAGGDGGIHTMTLNSLDYRLSLYDLREHRHGTSRQIDDQLREYDGDVLFDGESLHILESERYTGFFLDLGEERKPDTEFSLFHALRIYKRGFQMLHFPFRDRHVHYDGIEPGSFFLNRRDAARSVKLAIGHVYLIRFHHRTAVGDERMYIFRVIEHTPGVTFTALYRELASHQEP